MTDDACTFKDTMDLPRAHVGISFLRPDRMGGGVYRSDYDVLNPLDVGIINKNIADGYRIIALSAPGPEVLT